MVLVLEMELALDCIMALKVDIDTQARLACLVI
jgi:hypothetical protein